MSLKVIRVCDTCKTEHEQEVYDDAQMREYMGQWECSDCLQKREEAWWLQLKADEKSALERKTQRIKDAGLS